MSDEQEKHELKHTESSVSESKAVSRREFLKMAGIAGAAVGMGAGIVGLVTACGGETTTTAPSVITTAATQSTTTTTAAPASTTTVAASAEEGRVIKVGYVMPKTGAIASFAIPTDWIIQHWMTALADGVVAGDGKNHKFEMVPADTQSDVNRAAQVTGDLIQNSKVDVVFSAGTPDTCNPASDQCEAFGTPGISNNVPMEPWFFGRGGTVDKPFKWSWAVASPFFALTGSWVQMWDQLPTNKKVGMFFANSADGQAFSDPNTGAPYFAKQGGYEVTMPDLYAPGTEDFTSVISEFKKIGCEIVASICVPPDFTNFWAQAIQQGLRPKIMTCGLALLFEETVIAIGPTAIGLTCECPWHPSWPYIDSLTGMTDQQLADDYEAKTGRQWTQAVMQIGTMELFVDAVKRTKNIDDKAELSAAIGSAKLTTAQGPVDFTAKVGSEVHPVPNAVTAPMAGGQWRKSTDPRWQYQQVYLASTYVPGMKAGTAGTLEPIKYS
jgi:branched-chain amino acid transport system substrate-binding protein